MVWTNSSSARYRLWRDTDRGVIAARRRADLILVEATGARPVVVAAIVAGRVVYLTEAARIHRGH